MTVINEKYTKYYGIDDDECDDLQRVWNAWYGRPCGEIYEGGDGSKFSAHWCIVQYINRLLVCK